FLGCSYHLALLVQFCLRPPPSPVSALFPYTTLFRSGERRTAGRARWRWRRSPSAPRPPSLPSPSPRRAHRASRPRTAPRSRSPRSEEHTSELQSRENLVCRLLLEKKKISKIKFTGYL